MSRNEMKFTFTPISGAAGGFPLKDFLQQLDAIRKTLSFADRMANSLEHDCFDYEISGLSMNSPATVSLEPISVRNDAVAAVFHPKPALTVIWKLTHGDRLDEYEVRYIEGLRPIAEALKNSDTSSIDIQYSGSTVSIPRNLGNLIDDCPSGDELNEPQSKDQPIYYEMYAVQEAWELGSVTGRLESVNFHSGNECGIYTPFRNASIRCKFPDELVDFIKTHLRCKVEAFGCLRTPAGKPFPERLDIQSIKTIPETPVRSLRSMRGVL